MSVSAPDAPLAAVEQDAEKAVPAVVEPAVEAAAAQLNAVVAEAKQDVPAEQAAAAAKDPGVAGVLADVEGSLSGHALSPSVGAADLGQAVREVKAGYKTTEFWLTTVALALTNFSVVKIPGKYGQAITDAAAIAAYALSRGLAKLAPPALDGSA